MNKLYEKWYLDLVDKKILLSHIEEEIKGLRFSSFHGAWHTQAARNWRPRIDIWRLRCASMATIDLAHGLKMARKMVCFASIPLQSRSIPTGPVFLSPAANGHLAGERRNASVMQFGRIGSIRCFSRWFKSEKDSAFVRTHVKGSEVAFDSSSSSHRMLLLLNWYIFFSGISFSNAIGWNNVVFKLFYVQKTIIFLGIVLIKIYSYES